MSASSASRQLPRLLGVVGAGQMGAGIAQVAALKGLDVVLHDVSEAALERGLSHIRRQLDKAVRKQSLKEGDAAAALTRIRPSADLGVLQPAEFVVEAVSEDEQLKRRVLSRLDQVVGEGAVLASNTSSISITRLAVATQRPANVIGMHFMNPVPVMHLVELIRGMATSQQTYDTARGLAEALGKTVSVSEDRPGFVVNRILMPMINEAFYTLMEGVASAEDIDKGMKLGTNVPMGPLTLADYIGLDTCLAIMRVLHQGLGDDKYRPCPLLVQYVDAGWLGKKAFKGVYSYAKPL